MEILPRLFSKLPGISDGNYYGVNFRGSEIRSLQMTDSGDILVDRGQQMSDSGDMLVVFI